MIKEIIAIVESVNVNKNIINLNVVSMDKEYFNIRCDLELEDEFKKNKTYYFECDANYNEQRDRIEYSLTKYENVYEYYKNDVKELEHVLNCFYNYAPMNKDDIKNEIFNYLNSIKNEVYKNITLVLLNKYLDKFLIYPAALRFHHNYFGGLSYHTLTMLQLSKKIMEVYTFLDSDLVYSGIILHDLMKIKEFDDPIVSEYTLEGQLIGHLNMISEEVYQTSFNLGYQDKEEVILLRHLLLAHHGIPNYGSPKRPLLAEALLVYYIDTIDSKFSVLKEELNNTRNGRFTDNIDVVDKLKFYKPKK